MKRRGREGWGKSMFLHARDRESLLEREREKEKEKERERERERECVRKEESVCARDGSRG